MNYIGSKLSLLEFIEEVIIKEVEQKDNLILCDIFSGTGVVGKYFKEKNVLQDHRKDEKYKKWNETLERVENK